jgi:hypothetical protein
MPLLFFWDNDAFSWVLHRSIVLLPIRRFSWFANWLFCCFVRGKQPVGVLLI